MKIRTFILSLLACVFPAVAQVQPLEPEDIIVWWQCAANCNNDPAKPLNKPTTENPMCMSYGLYNDFENGWLKHLTTRVYPQYEDGYRRFFFHLPFGSEYGNHSMDLDQPLDNIEEGRPDLNENFMRALDWMADNMPDAEIGAYLGTNEDDLDAELNAANAAAHWQRISGAGYNIRLITNPQVSIGFDAATRYREGDPYHSFYAVAKAYKELQGRRTYIEAMPRRGEDYRGDGMHGPDWAWQADENYVVFERAYFHQHRRWMPGESPVPLTGQGVRVILSGQDIDRWNQLADERGYDNDDLFDWVANCHENGYEFAVGLTNPAHPWKGMTAQAFADTVNTRLGFIDTEPEPDPEPDPQPDPIPAHLDLNGDGVLNGDDIAQFTEFFNEHTDRVKLFDLNGDGVLDNTDVGIWVEQFKNATEPGEIVEDPDKPVVFFMPGAYEQQKRVMQRVIDNGIRPLVSYGMQINSNKQGVSNYPQNIDLDRLGVSYAQDRIKAGQLWQGRIPSYDFYDYEPRPREGEEGIAWLHKTTYDDFDIALAQLALSELRDEIHTAFYGPTIPRALDAPRPVDIEAFKTIVPMIDGYEYITLNLYPRSNAHPITDANIERHRKRIQGWHELFMTVADGRLVMPLLWLDPNIPDIDFYVEFYLTELKKLGVKRVGFWMNPSSESMGDRLVKLIDAISEDITTFAE